MKRTLGCLLTCACLALLLAGCGKQPAAFTLTDITGASFAQGFSLNDHRGQPRTLQDYKGRVVWLFFGYTQCPDVCPTMMSQLALARKKMGAEADRVQVLFVTLDPERDTPAILAQYVPAFDPSFVGLYGTAQQTRLTADTFKAFYAKNVGDNPAFYTMDHASQVFVFDAEGRVRLLYTPSSSIDMLVADTRQLLAQ